MCNSEKGSAIIEFAIGGIGVIFALVSAVGMSLSMWTYNTLKFAVAEGARYAAVHGQQCSVGSNSCGITVANIANQIASSAVGLDAGKMNVTLTSSSGSITCNPLNTCSSNGTAWPPSGANIDGSSQITISGTYPEQSGLMVLFLPYTGSRTVQSRNLMASSQQTILF
ncbi:MAG: pilus assembly protein [Acidobacteriaceae bacterium]|nr:pilus assembly protein [Acidobacteriaceae bacterium]